MNTLSANGFGIREHLKKEVFAYLRQIGKNPNTAAFEQWLETIGGHTAQNARTLTAPVFVHINPWGDIQFPEYRQPTGALWIIKPWILDAPGAPQYSFISIIRLDPLP